jgi:ribose 5-phosphate isomerase
MIILQIEHPVPDYNGWKKAFDSDPMGRKQSGVKRYKIYRQSDNSNNVIVDLEFDTIDEAKDLQAKLKQLWNQVEGKIITGPKARIIEMVESREY